MSRLGLLGLWSLLALAGPTLAAAGSADGGSKESGEAAVHEEPASGSAAEGPEEERAGDREDSAAGRDGPPPNNFRLFSRRNVALRLRPNAGLRLPRRQPVFSPRTADFEGREREQGPLFAVAASIAFLDARGERDSFKGQEFRDLSESAAVGLDAQLRGGSDWLRLTGRHLLLDDRDFLVEWRRFGVFKTSLFSNRIPHNFAFDARSLYSGIGSGRLTLGSGVQETLEASTSLVDGAARLRDLVAGAMPVDVGLVRDRLAFAFELTAFDPLAVRVTVDDESRQGARPWSGSFGFASFVEIPWPVDYDTGNVRVEAEYHRGSTLVRGSYYLSSFDNNISDVVFDNPWRSTDSSAGGPIYVFGPAAGRIDLYPSNEQRQLTLTAVRSRLPGRSTFQATVAWNRMEQDDPLLPFTTNTAVVPGARGAPPFDASDPANLPAGRADAELESRLIHLRWTSRLSDRLSLKARFRDYELENETAQIFLPGYTVEDLFWRRYNGAPGGAFTNLPIAHRRTSYGIELGYRLDPRTRLTLSWDREEIDREFREVEETDEDRFKLALDTKPAAWVELKASYLRSEREAGEYDFAQFFRNQGIGIDATPILPFLRKFDQAARDRDRAQLIASFYPSEALTVGAQVIVGADDYPESGFGVLGDDHEVYALDLSYAASERLSFFASFSSERYEVELRGREWFPGAPSDPYRNETGFASASNWTAETVDEVDTVTVGLDLYLIPEKLHLDLSYSYSKSDGRILYASPIAPAAADLNPFDPADFPEVDDVTFYNLNPELEYEVSGKISLALAYLREKYEILDFNGDGFELVPTTPSGVFNGGLLQGALPGDYDIDVVALKLKLKL